jgi:O-antigen/teichoic acid export membrane protein
VSERPRLSTGAGIVFAARTLTVVLAAATTILIARLLGPEAMGGYYLLALVPTTMLALLSMGVPSAITYHTGRGIDVNEIRTLAIVLPIGLSALIVFALLVLQPFLLSTVLAAAPPGLVPVSILAIPGFFVLSSCNAVILGRQRVRWYAALQAIQAIALFIGQLVVVGVLRGGLEGAIWTYVVIVNLMALVSAVLMIRLAPFRPVARAGTVVQLLGFGIVLQPAAMAGFFNYRADVYLMSTLLRDPAALGVYGLAVNIAELCFFIPDAVSTVLYPRVAAAESAESAAFVPVVTRTVLLLTSAAAALIACAVLIAIPIVLPAFSQSVVPALLLLPGIIGLSASKVLSAYMTGSGRPALVSAVSVAALVLNVGLNLALIPVIGPPGAALASLISYSAHGTMMVIIASRQARVGIGELSRPRRADVALVIRTLAAPIRSGSPR